MTHFPTRRIAAGPAWETVPVAAPRNVAVRPAEPQDARQVGDVFLAARAESPPHVQPALNDAETRCYLAGLIGNPSFVMWVAQHCDTVVGFLALRENWVDHLHVQPAWHRRGIGTRLLDCAKRARPHGLRLFCFECNHRARAFYAARGLVPVLHLSGSGDQPDMEYRWTPSP